MGRRRPGPPLRIRLFKLSDSLHRARAGNRGVRAVTGRADMESFTSRLVHAFTEFTGEHPWNPGPATSGTDAVAGCRTTSGPVRDRRPTAIASASATFVEYHRAPETVREQHRLVVLDAVIPRDFGYLTGCARLPQTMDTQLTPLH